MSFDVLSQTAPSPVGVRWLVVDEKTLDTTIVEGDWDEVVHRIAEIVGDKTCWIEGIGWGRVLAEALAEVDVSVVSYIRNEGFTNDRCVICLRHGEDREMIASLHDNLVRLSR